MNGAGLAAGVLNALYHVVVARMLGPVDYGTLSALGTLALLLQTPVSVISLVYTRRGAKPSEVGRHAAGWVGVGVALWLALCAVSGPVAHLFHLPSDLVVVAGLTVLPALAYGAFDGILQWAASFGWVGALTTLDSLTRTIGAFATYVGRLGLTGLIVFGPLTALIDLAVSWFGVRRAVRWATRQGLPHFTGLVNAGGVGVLALLLTSTDVLVAKHGLPPRAAGYYSGLATMGRAPVFFAGAVGTVLLSSAQRDAVRARRYLVRSLLLVGILGTVGVLVYVVAGRLAVSLMLGSRFLPMLPLLVVYTAAMTMQSGILVGLYYGAAQNWRLPTVAAAAGFLVWMALLWTSHRLDPLILRTIWVMAIILAAVLGSVGWLEWQRPRPARQRPDQ
ncbi:MAG: oligosaccharide flippase family protein [Thermaerobacter sp.]|nr:oligosaccharide flippase family protein [Thermaerobacter sp.]